MLALSGIKQDTAWTDAGNERIRIHDIIRFANTFYGASYAENSREAFRKLQKAIIEEFAPRFAPHSEALARETEVWIAEMPEHMIHLNGEKFFGPRQKF